MRRFSAHLLAHVLTILLIVGGSVCCCQARFIVAGLSAGDQCAAASANDDAVPSCCRNTKQHDDDKPAAPDRGCGECCIKAVNLVMGVYELPSANLTAIVPPAAVETLLEQPHRRSIPIAMQDRDGGTSPPTLLRLRCALIV